MAVFEAGTYNHPNTIRSYINSELTLAFKFFIGNFLKILRKKNTLGDFPQILDIIIVFTGNNAVFMPLPL